MPKSESNTEGEKKRVRKHRRVSEATSKKGSDVWMRTRRRVRRHLLER
jgi:hypothetical protein